MLLHIQLILLLDKILLHILLILLLYFISKFKMLVLRFSFPMSDVFPSSRKNIATSLIL